MALKFRRGTNADRTTITPEQGEPIYTTDTKKLFIGDGSTAGGVEVGGENAFATIAVAGQSNVVADSSSDTLTLAAGSGITLTTNAGTDTVTIAASGGGSLTIDTQDFTASGTWTKPANALWVEVTMCGAGEAGGSGTTGTGSVGGSAGRVAAKTFLASDLGSTVAVTCGTAMAYGIYSNTSTSSFGTHLYALGASAGGRGYTLEGAAINNTLVNGAGAGPMEAAFSAGGDLGTSGRVGPAFGPGGGGSAGVTGNGFDGGKASSGEGGTDYCFAKTGGGGAGGASGTTGVAGTAGGYDTITGFGHGGGGGGEGTAGAGGAGGAAVRGGGGGGGGKGTTAGGAGGAGGAGFVRVRTMCFG